MKETFDRRLLALRRRQVANLQERLRALRVSLDNRAKRLRVRSRYAVMRFWGASREGGSDSIRADRFGLANCEIRYINLRHRQDRNRRIRNEFRRLGIDTPTRIEAFRENYGALGCAKSHVEALRTPA